MSDPAKTPEEIEDVLASIRRLVSDHTPGPDGSMRPAEKPVADQIEADGPSDRLVLTASLRVQEPDDPWSPVAETEQDSAEADTSVETGIPGDDASDIEPEAPDETDNLVLDVIAQVGTASEDDTSDSDWQPDDRMAEYDTVGPADEEVVEPPVEEVVGASDALQPSDVTEAGDKLVEAVELASSDLPETDFESETGDDNWPSDGAEAALLTLVARREPANQSSEVELPEQGLNDPTTDEGEPEVAASEDPVEDAEENTEVVSDAAAEPEISEETQEEPPVTPIFSRRMTQTEEASEERAQDVEAEDLGEEPSPFTFPESDEGILDEETLREIIVDVVREELQGVLGQRITRNVRKMVRREIRLALAAEDLD